MHLDIAALPPGASGKLMNALVVPRPIALTVTVDGQGRVNAAPFSYFNVMSADPPVVVLGTGRAKHTALNIAETGEFVVNLVPFDLAGPMNVTAAEYPRGVDELAAAGLTPLPSISVRPPRIAECPASLECRLIQSVDTGGSIIQVGRVLHLHVRDDLIDPQRLHIATERMDLIARLHGGGWYARLTDLFEMPRPPQPPVSTPPLATPPAS